MSVVRDGRRDYTYLLLLNYLLDLSSLINSTTVQPQVREYTSAMNNMLTILIMTVLKNSSEHIHIFLRPFLKSQKFCFY